MPLNIEIQDDQISDLSSDAKIKLKKQINDYTVDLLKEARFIEKTLRADGAGKEITSNHIVRAVRKSKNYFKKRIPWYVKFCKLLSPICSIFVGALFTPDSWSNEQWKAYLFVIAFGIAIAATIFQFSKEDE